jgi:hypothetical protein
MTRTERQDLFRSAASRSAWQKPRPTPWLRAAKRNGPLEGVLHQAARLARMVERGATG